MQTTRQPNLTRPATAKAFMLKTLGLLFCILSFSLSGCVNKNAMLERARADAIRTRLEEMPLGDFRITMPQDKKISSFTEVSFEIYATAPHYRIEEIEKQLEERNFIFRQNVLLEIRQSTPEDLAEPDLSILSKKLAVAANSVLEKKLIQTVGFRRYRVIHQ